MIKRAEPKGTERNGTPGPEPDRLKIDLPWEDAVKRVVRKGDPEPADGPEKKEGSKD